MYSYFLEVYVWDQFCVLHCNKYFSVVFVCVCVCINLLYSKIRKPHDVKVLII
jgi:hypothetical protein